MGFSLGSALGGLAGGIGSYFGAKEDLRATRETNAASAYEAMVNRNFQAEEAQKAYERNLTLQRTGWELSEKSADKARDYDTMMSNTAVSRRMQDLKSSGLNPILALQKEASSPMSPSPSAGSPAAGSPSGSMASFLKSDKGKLMADTIYKSVSSAVEIRKLRKEVDLVSSVEKLNKSLAKKNIADAKLKDAMKPGVGAVSSAKKGAIEYGISGWSKLIDAPFRFLGSLINKVYDKYNQDKDYNKK